MAILPKMRWLIGVYLPLAFAGDVTQQPILESKMSRSGSTDTKPIPCSTGKLCASLGDPYRFNWFDSIDIERASLTALQNIGFSVNPPRVDYSFAECDAKQEQQHSRFKQFWTDQILLDQRTLEKMNVTWSELGIQANKNLIYRFQLFGCYYATESRKRDPCMEYFTSRQTVSTGASGTLILTMTMQRRARKGQFQSITDGVYPKKLLDHIDKLIKLEVQNLTPSTCEVSGAGVIT